ncbi:BQ5605_C007g04661 [Microbotryum silenes-dioicae]|uniref:uracil phosphoribosyltransferase n=1 Tax=Microbotryum silenes-dioicae TaxID=796604 RepID=A0A2X0N1R7_9BASI|nr:BQ5605_C007g04661 [Microbotryum silenes-dioicae]
MPLHIVSHPILSHKLTQLRDAKTTSADFRRLVSELSTMMAIEASRDLETRVVPNLSSPVARFEGHEIAAKIGISPILRAGIGMTDALLFLFPTAQVFYLGLFREKISLQPIEYYQKLPPKPTIDRLFILDPLIATGGTAIAAVEMLLEWGMKVEDLKLIGLVASQVGADNVLKAFPGLNLWVGQVDQELTVDGMILPGLGDSGDRLFNTVGLLKRK